MCSHSSTDNNRQAATSTPNHGRLGGARRACLVLIVNSFDPVSTQGWRSAFTPGKYGPAFTPTSCEPALAGCATVNTWWAATTTTIR